MGDLTKNFSFSEFKCPCPKCLVRPDRGIPINRSLVDKLQVVRDSVGFPLYVNSGVRCPDHNDAVSGSPSSSHLKGLAADIAFDNNKQAFALLKAGFESGFRRIGKYATFIHFDVDPVKGQEVLW